MQQYRKNLGKVSLTTEGAWDRNKFYEILSIVYEEHTQHGFISRKAVPIGVDINNKEYWMPFNVSGYADNNTIILNQKESETTIKSYTLEEAIKSIASVGRKPGTILGFYNENTDRLDIGGRWELWQYNGVDVADWENVNSWDSIYYNYNKFVGWYRSEESLKKYIPFPEVGCYAYVGIELNEAIIYRCDRKYVWTNTTEHVWDYIKVIVGGNVTIGENGNWFNNGVDTNIPASIKGENGKTPIIRNNNNIFEVSYDNLNWTKISDELAAWFRWQSKGGQQTHSVGKIQITRNGLSWTDLSGEFVNNLRISRYIGADDSLPTSGIAEGTIYAKGPYYEDDDTLHEYPAYRIWVYAWKGNTLAWVDHGQFTSIAAGIVQETGDGEEVVMSQKAVTEKLSELGSEVKATVNTNDTNYFANSGFNENGNGFISENYISMKKAVPINDNTDIECVVNGGTVSGVMVFYNDSNEIIYTSGTWNKTIQSSDFKGATKVIASFGFDVKNAEIKQNGDILWRKETTGTVSGKVSELENYINGDVISVTENYIVQRIPNTSQIVYIHRFGYLTLDQLIEVEEGTVNWVHKDDVPRSCVVYLLDDNLEYVDIYYSDRNVITIPSNVRYIKASFKDADGIMLSQNGVVLFDKSMIGSKMLGAKNMVLQNKRNSKEIRKDIELIKSLIGVEPIVVPSEKEESVTTIDVEVGKNYTFFFLETNWSRSWVANNIAYLAAFSGSVEYFSKTNNKNPNGFEYYIPVEAKTDTISIRFRKDKGEEIHWFVVEEKDSARLIDMIAGIIKDIDTINKSTSNITAIMYPNTYTVPSDKEEVIFTFKSEVGVMYRISFLETNWSRSWVKGNIAYVAAFYGDVEYFARSPLYYPDGVEPYIDIVAKTENVSIRFRKDKGEELHWYIVEMKESSELTTVIGNARKDVDGVNGNLLASTIDNNGGYLQLKRVFENLKITMKDKNTPCVLAWTSDAHNSLDNLERMLNFCSTFEDYIDDIIHTGDGVADKITDSNPFENIDGGSKVLNVVGNHDCNDINHTVGSTDVASGLHTYEKLFANNIQYWNVVQPTDASSLGKCYYYKDYTDTKLRVVVLDCMHWDSSQRSWFEEVLNSAIPIDYHVIAVSHYIFSGFVSGIRKCTFHSIFGEKYVPLNAQSLNEEASDCVASAINNGLKFVCWMFGHLHYDVFAQSTKHEEQFGIGITRTSSVSSYSSDSIRSKYKDRDAFNIISVDTTLGIITVKRIGDTYDKLLRSRNNLVFDYINREILFND